MKPKQTLSFIKMTVSGVLFERQKAIAKASPSGGFGAILGPGLTAVGSCCRYHVAGKGELVEGRQPL